MFNKANLYLFTVVLVNSKEDTYKQVINFESSQPILVNKGDFINPRGFSLDYGFDIFKVIEIEHMIYDRNRQLINSTTVFVNLLEKDKNPISRWTYQYESIIS